jgi:hypothetical protein
MVTKLWPQSYCVKHTLCHCGTGNAGDGSKHLADARAMLVTSKLINMFAMNNCISLHSV